MQGSLFGPPTLVFEAPSGLPPIVFPKPVPPPKIHWVGDDGRNVFLEIQGQFVAVAVAKGPMSVKPAKRQKIVGFSAGSRLRLFKLVNRIDFGRAGMCSFVTLTWPDGLGRPTPAMLTKARSRFQRRWERFCGMSTCGLWRVEWMERLRGRFRGTRMPHLHVIYFDVPYVPQKDVERMWTAACRSPVRARVDIRKVKNLRMMLYYVSKYIAKLDSLGSLVIPSYLTAHMPGRKWGVFRRALMPLAEKFEMRVMPGPLIDAVRALATKHWAKTPQVADMGFTVFGPAAEEIRRLVDDWSGHEPDGEVR